MWAIKRSAKRCLNRKELPVIEMLHERYRELAFKREIAPPFRVSFTC